MSTGLTLGKFAPLHRGHQFIIETMLAENETATVIIYDSPEVTTIPLPIRAGWIKTLYPSVTVVEAWGGPIETGDTPRIKAMHENYILNELGIRGITRFYSSEWYGDHVSTALGAENRIVDERRESVPISATMIRSNPFKYRDFLHPLVYRDFITNVVLLGAPSTGKTTLAEALAREYGTVWMPEYGREYWAEHQSERRLAPEQLEAIAEGHLLREDQKLLEADTYLFTDTNALTTYHFALSYHGSTTPRLSDLARQTASRYDLVLLCDDDIPFDDTWDRSGEVQRVLFQKQIRAELAARKIPFFTLRGDLASRVARVREILAVHRKYQNPLAPYDL